MTPRRRARLATVTLATAAITLATTLAAAPTALAAAGGGTSGFGGGGEGGGHGGGFAIYIIFQLLFRLALLGHGLGLLIILGLILIYIFLYRTVPAFREYFNSYDRRGRQARGQTAKRSRRVELAAAVAAEDDPAFAPDRVREGAIRLFTDIQEAWDDEDRGRLAMLVGPDLMSEWGRRLDDFARKGWHNRVQLLEPPHVVYVGLRRGSSDLPDRVTVRIDARLRDYVVDRRGRHIKHLGRMTETTRLREFWTLGRRDHRWILVSIEQGAEGAHALKDQIVATPWSDDSGLRDQAIVEQAVAEALPADVAPAEVASLEFAGDARAAALDLSLADGRFAPDVLEVAARRAVAAWTEAIDGDDQALKQIADPQAIEQLLYPGDPSHRTRLVVRGAAVKEIRITGLDPAASPPQMELEIELHGARYIEDRDTAAVIAGSQTRASSFVEHWTLALTGDEREPWRIVRAGTGALTA